MVGGRIAGLALVGSATRDALAALGAGLAALGQFVVAQWRGCLARSGAFGSLFVACFCGQRWNGKLGVDSGLCCSKGSFERSV